MLATLLAVLPVFGGDPVSAQPPAEVTVFAASSLQDTLKDLKTRYEKTHPGVKLILSFGASGQLQTQIAAGAPADLFISAAPEYMDKLATAGLLRAGSRCDLLGNELVLIAPVPDGRLKSLAGLQEKFVERIALGEPGSVPAGQYAVASLRTLALHDALKPKFIFALNVRQVLDLVARGEVDAGFVYRSDAMQSSQVRIAATVPDESHPPIVYPAAVIAGRPQMAAAGEFLNYLAGPEAQAVFRTAGFKPPPSAAAKP